MFQQSKFGLFSTVEYAFNYLHSRLCLSIRLRMIWRAGDVSEIP